MIISIDTPERIKSIQDRNAKLAKDELDKIIDDYKTQQARKALKLDYKEVDISSVQMLDSAIKKPSADKNYVPLI